MLGFNVWSGVQILGMGVSDFEDFLISNNILPLGSVIYLLFCVCKRGWGWDHFLKEANTGDQGLRFPKAVRFYVSWVLPAVVLFIFVMGYWNKFA